MRPRTPLVLLELFTGAEQSHMNKHVHANSVVECAMWGACGVAHMRSNSLPRQSGRVKVSLPKRFTAVVSF